MTKLYGWSPRSMLARYDIAAAQDLDDGVARLGAFLEGKAHPPDAKSGGRAAVRQV